MNEQERLEVLQLLSSGKMSAEEAAKVLNSPTMTIEVERKPPPSAPEPEVEIDVDDEPEVAVDVEDEPEIEIEMDEDAPRKEANTLRINVMNDVGNLDIDLVIPVPLLKLGEQIGDRFAPRLNGWDWRELDIDINFDALHVRVAAEQGDRP